MGKLTHAARQCAIAAAMAAVVFVQGVSAAEVQRLWVRRVSDCAAQSGGVCGSENGSSFENAYRGQGDVSYSATDGTATAVDPGDVLISCVKVGEAMTDADKDTATVMIAPSANVAGGGVNNRTRFTGDCSEIPGYLAMAPLDGGGALVRGIDSGSTSANNAYWEIDHFEIYNFTTYGIIRQGLNTTAQHWDIHDNYVHDIRSGTGGQGIDTRGANITERNNVIARSGNDNAYHEGDNFTFEGNESLDPSQDTATGDGLQMDKQAANTLITGNLFTSAKDAKQCVFISTTEIGTGAGEISYNKCFGPSATSALHTAFFAEDGAGPWEFIGNYAERSRYLAYCGGPAVTTECHFRGNVGRDFSARGIQSGTGTVNAIIDHNTVDNAATCFSTESATGTSTITNNIGTGCTTAGIAKNAGDTEARNLIFDSAEFVLNEAAPTTPGTGAVQADPQYVGGANPQSVGGFALGARSPAVGAASDSGEVLDHFGDAFYSGSDIGAIRRDQCYRRGVDGSKDFARRIQTVQARCRGIPPRYPEGL